MVQKALFNLPIEAGVYTEETERGATGRWHRADKVRFRKGLPEKIGGWLRKEPRFLGTCRNIIDWTSLDGRNWTAMGTELKLYLWQNSTLYDITPIRRSVTLGTDPFAVVSGSAIVTVTDTAHAAQEGDFVRFNGATAGGGITIDGEYRIVEVLTANTYTIEHTSAATSTDATTGGAAVDAEYDISVGGSSTVIGNGYGTGPYSSGGYSEPIVNSTAVVQLRTWSLDTWGEDLMACPYGGAIYWWDRTNGPDVRAQVIDDVGVPQINNFIIVSQSSRQIISLGAYDNVNARVDPLLIRWCSQEDFTSWTPTTTNTAGDIRAFNGSKFVTGIRARGEILVFTNSSVHSMIPLGGSAGFGLTTLGENISILGPNAICALDHRVFFMSDSDFYIYDGVLRVLPCDVRNYIYESLTIDQRAKVHAGINRNFNEIWWFYPALPEEIWFDGDFSLSDEDVDMRMQRIGGVPLWSDSFWSQLFWADDFWIEEGDGTTRYSVLFNSSGGYIELDEIPPITGIYDAVYITNSGAPIVDHLDAEYEMIFTAPITTSTLYGLAFHITDLSGLEDTAADNIQAICAEINPSNSLARFTKRNSDGTFGGFLTNDPANHDLTLLPFPVTITASNQYGLIVRREGSTLSMFIWDEDTDITQLVTSVELTASEQALYFNGSAGPLLGAINGSSIPTLQSAVHVHSFRIAESGTLLRQNPGDTTYTRNTANEVTRYAIFNYEEGTWSIGSMPRTAWRDRSPVLGKPYAAGTDGYLYQHETGVDDHEDALESYIESYMMEIPDAGEDLMHIDKLIPDFINLDGSVKVKVRGRKYPQSDTLIEKGPFTVDRDTQFISPRIRARQVALRIESDQIGDRWRSGRWRARAGAHGKR